MFGYSTVFGIDSHARTTTVCALVVETGETETRTFPGNPYADIAAWMGRFPQPPLGVYESGCTGFVPARLLSGGGVTAVPVAAGAIRPSARSLTLAAVTSRVWTVPASASSPTWALKPWCQFWPFLA